MNHLIKRVLNGVWSCPEPRYAHGVAVRDHLADLIRVGMSVSEQLRSSPSQGSWLRQIGEMEPRLRGFCYEAAGTRAMVEDLLDGGDPTRTKALLLQAPEGFQINAHIGVGMAFASTHLPLISLSSTISPLYECAVYDGLGFMLGLLRPRRYIDEKRAFRVLKSDVFAIEEAHRGLGRSLWYLCTGWPQGLVEAISSFDPEYHGHLWRGVGVAGAYSGGAPPQEFDQLQHLAGAHQAALASGIGIAALVSAGNGHISVHTQNACRRVWHQSTEEVAAIVQSLSPALNVPDGRAASRAWDEAIRDRWRRRPGGA